MLQHNISKRGRWESSALFDFYLNRGDYATSKPSAEPYLLALMKSGQSTHDLVVIEDSPRGLAATKTDGLVYWVIPGEHTSEQNF